MYIILLITLVNDIDLAHRPDQLCHKFENNHTNFQMEVFSMILFELNNSIGIVVDYL